MRKKAQGERLISRTEHGMMRKWWGGPRYKWVGETKSEIKEKDVDLGNTP